MRSRLLLRALARLAAPLAAAVAAFGCATSGSSEQPLPLVDAGHEGYDVLSEPPEAAPEAEAAPIICYPDSDNDGIPDEIEGASDAVDTDGDGTLDYLDADSDDDTIPDAIEGDVASAGCMTPRDSDGDGVPDYRDSDSDDNGLPDKSEVHPDGTPYDPQTGVSDTDGDKYPDYADPDNDGDALPDTFELVAGAAVDTDKDGVPDLDDTDADGDTIDDQYEGTSDADGDAVPNFRDLDSDDDGVPDSCEAGIAHKQHDPPTDVDLDGKYDFLDKDADGDGLLDGEEDKNGDCICDCDAGGKETNRLYADSDLDGSSDLIEVTLGSDPNDPTVTPQSMGQYYFLLPYNKDPDPKTRAVPVDTGLQRADAAFFVDTTGTMGGEIAELKNGLSSMITKLSQTIPDVAVGVAAHDDFPVSPYGLSQDQPFYLPTPDAKVTTDLAKTLAAVSTLTTHDGGDLPEGQIPAMYRGLTNDYLQWPGMLLQPDAIGTGVFGSLAFRSNALPILIEITDAPFHNGRRASSPASLHDTYSFNNQSPYKVPTADTLVSSMTAKGARFIGIASDDGVRSGDPYEDLAWLSDATGSLVPPVAFGGATCNTGLGGNPLAGGPDGPGSKCRLVFDIQKTGLGLTDRVIDGVRALVGSLTLDVRVMMISDAPDASNGWVDSVDTFVSSVQVLPGGDPDPNSQFVCWVIPLSQVSDGWTGPKGETQGPDLYADTVKAAPSGKKICFGIEVVPNTTIQPADHIQKFHAVLQVRAKNGLSPKELDFGPPRDVLFLVPAKPQ
jgi:hypothetical protein